MRRDDHLLRSRIPKLPGLGPLRVSNEDALASVRLQRFPVLLAHQHIGQAAKNTEIGHIWLPPIALPSSVGYATIQCSCGHAISCVDKGRDGVHPERRRELGLG